MKVWLALAAGMAIVLGMAVVTLAWIKGGVGPARTVEIPLQVPLGAPAAPGTPS